jgi:hypothetical protein
MKTHKQIMEELRISDPESYEEIIRESNAEIAAIKKSWGGKRKGSGRTKSETRKKSITKRLDEQTIIKIKEYSKAKNINETKALEELIDYGYNYTKSVNQ